MKKDRKERGVECITVEVTAPMMEMIDKIAEQNESSRSGVVRLAIKRLFEHWEAPQLAKGGAK